MSLSGGILTKSMRLTILVGGMALTSPSAFAQTSTGSASGSASCAVTSDLDTNPETSADKAAADVKKAGGKDLSSAISGWKSKRSNCRDRNVTAQRECYEACSKHAQGAQSGAGAIGSLMNIVSGLTNQTCEQQGSAAQTLQNGYQSYSAACKSAQKSCNDSCGDADTARKDIEKQLASACAGAKPECMAATQAVTAALKMDDNTDNRYVAGKKSQCEKEFSSMLGNASQLLGELGKMIAGAKKCEDETDSSDDAAADDTVAALDCSKPENMTNMTCICQADPRRQGCPNYSDSSSPSSSDLGSYSAVPPGLSSGETTGQPNAEAVTPGNNGSSAGGGSTAGGGYSGGGGFGSGNSASNAAEKAKEKKGLSADILKGEESGGGGSGGGWGSFGSGNNAAGGTGSGSGSGAATKQMAGQFTNEVSGPGGRDNYQKVKERYFDNQPTFDLSVQTPAANVLNKRTPATKGK